MTLAELGDKLATTGYPVAYLLFPEKKAMPFIAYYVNREEVLGADNKVDATKKLVSVELYTKTKDEVAECKVETALSDDFIWKKTENYIFDERCFCITYDIEVI